MSTPIKTEHPHVVKVPGVRGGRPTIKGTRIAIDLVARFLKSGTDAAGILDTYPHLSPAAVHDAINYYYDHQAEIDQELAETRAQIAERHGVVLDERGNVVTTRS
jgi:uncharacterized protein (DUF433 family)